jgi:hypothetical protein
MSNSLVFTCTCGSDLVGTVDVPKRCPNCGRVFLNGKEAPKTDDEGHDLEWHRKHCLKCVESGSGSDVVWCEKARVLAETQRLP